MTQCNLEQRLSLIPKDARCLCSSQGNLSVAELIEQASILRAGCVNGAGARIALCGLDVLEFILAIVAFDGIAEAILLLPQSLDAITREELIKAGGCTHCLSPGKGSLEILERRSNARSNHRDTSWLLATSGTTGTPKLIEHSLATLTRTVKVNAVKGKEFSWGLLYDPSRFAGLQVILQAVLGGSRLALPQGKGFDAQVQSLLDCSVNALSATPTLWRKLLMDTRIQRLNLRQITLGGEIADQAILDALKRSFPRAQVTHIYASTEAGSGFAVKDGEVGFPLEWLEAGKGPIPLRIDKRGHLFLKPPVLPAGEAVSMRLDLDGYLDTEDQVSIQESRVVFHGRASGAINVGGNKINPERVEQVLRTVPGVLDAKVYPKKSSLVGQLVAADVVSKKAMDQSQLRLQIVEHCRAVLESWQVPALIRFVPALSVNSTGKVERQTL